MFMSAEEPMTPEEIAADYRLPLEAVQEAIAYCQSDPPEIKEDFEREEHIMAATGMNEPGLQARRQISDSFTPGTRPAWDMKIYLDEDLSSGLLASLLSKAGHDVTTPMVSALLGRSDAVQLTHAIAENRVCLSRNYKDFEELHLLMQQSNGRHAGIIVVRRENDPTRDMTPKGIVAAIRKLESAGAQLPTNTLF